MTATQSCNDCRHSALSRDGERLICALAVPGSESVGPNMALTCPKFERSKDMSDDLVKLARDCANGIASPKTDAGDLGLFDVLADELEVIRAENERLREAVTVKPLAWEDFSERSSKATAMLLTSYMVQRWSCGRFDLSISAPGYSTGLEGAGGFYDTMDAAKAAAQADFESRIRAALNERKGDVGI